MDVRRCGSAALDLAYLAAGRNDMFFELMLSPWDIAAGYLLIKEAGGVISDTQGNEIDLSHPCPVLAANPVAYPYLLEKVKEVLN
jgi:myo-inositol-1(or 4)-monophosphatase